MLFDLQEAEFSREIIQRAERSIMVADATKFGRHAPVRVEAPGVIDTLVTDARPPEEIVGFLGEAGVGLVVAEKSVTRRSEEHTSELQSLMRISDAVFCLKKKNKSTNATHNANYEL